MSSRDENSQISVNAMVLAAALHLSPLEVLRRIRAREITAVHEHGIEEDAGRERLIFYDRHRRVQLLLDETGRIVECTVARVHRRGLARASGSAQTSQASDTTAVTSSGGSEAPTDPKR